VRPPRERPGPGQESVWDYPRPPRVEPFDGHVEVILNGRTIAETRRAMRVLETSHPPVYYIPRDDVVADCLVPVAGESWCEWKGAASSYDLVVGKRRVERGAWSYEQPTVGYEPIRRHVAFYAGPMDACLVNGERVRPQPGGFYGGWITDSLCGPFKGEPGSRFW